jgi:hypothetical protein
MDNRFHHRDIYVTYLSEASTLYCNVIGMLNLKAPSTIRQEKIQYWNEC